MSEQITTTEDCYVLPASFGQERLWLLDRLGPGNAYHISGAVRLDGPLDPAALARAVADVVDRHEILRTTFEFGLDGVLVQLVHPSMRTPMARVDPREPTLDAARAALAGHFDQPFDLADGPLLRTALVQFGETAWLFGVSMHHIVSDGWSIGVLITELAEYYRAEAGGTPATLPELTIQYGDFAAWQREYVEAADCELADYWRERLAEATVLTSPGPSAAEPRPGTPQAGASVPVAVPMTLMKAIEQVARQESVTPFMVLLAAYIAVLARWTEQDDIVVGTPVAGRERPELRGLIGFFVNTLPLRVRVVCESSFRVLLRQVREACLGAYAHQDLPFERIVEVSGAKRLPGRTPLVDAIIVLQNVPVSRWEVPGLIVEQVDLADALPQVALNLYLSGTPDGGLTGRLMHARPRWDSTDACLLAAGWLALLTDAVAHIDTQVGRLSLGAPAAAPMEPPVADGLVHHWIEKAACEHPDRIAITAPDGGSLTYRELDERSDRWARRVREHGAGPERLVAICMQRSIAQLIAVLGILKSGAAYLPLDPGHPKARIAKIVADAAPLVILTDETTAGLFDDCAGTSVLLATETPGDPPAKFDDADPDSLVYVIHTSGSTGTPKGAMNVHRGVVNLVWAAQRAFTLAPGEAVLHKTPVSFDVSAWEWMWPLTAGARLVLAGPDGHRDPRHIAGLIVAESVTTCHFVPSMLHAFLAEPMAAECRAGLRRVLCSGEEIPAALARRFREILPDTELYNTYGPAETAIEVSWHRVGPDDLGQLRIPIGRQLPGVRFHVLDRRGEPVPPGIPGELHVGGVAVGRGYLGSPALTADRFVPDPFAADGSRLYRTGDRVRVRPDGLMDFLGRYDHQVKLRGIRIEPAEIEAVLGQHADVSQAVVVVRGSQGADKHLVAYIGCRRRPPSADELRGFLLKRLPQSMVPSAFIVLSELPVTRNGKLDRDALPDTDFENLHSEEAVPPRTPVEELLGRIWAEVLSAASFGIRDNFYALGGNSLRAVQVFQRAQREGLLLPLDLMLGDHTIEQLAARLGADSHEAVNRIGRLLE